MEKVVGDYMYMLTKAIEGVIQQCIDFGSGEVVQELDGECYIRLSAEWVDYGDGKHDAVMVYIHDPKTKRVVHEFIIPETKIV